jgi:hypothetical protein
METILGGIKKLVEHIIARSNQAGCQYGQSKLREISPGQQGRLIEKGKEDSQEHKGVLAPVVNTGDLYIRPHT